MMLRQADKPVRLVAIFNAYDGTFEELRYSVKPQKYVFDNKTIEGRVRENLRGQRAEVIAVSVPELRYRPEAAPAGRFSPTWEAQVTVKEVGGIQRRIAVILNAEGQQVNIR